METNWRSLCLTDIEMETIKRILYAAHFEQAIERKIHLCEDSGSYHIQVFLVKPKATSETLPRQCDTVDSPEKNTDPNVGSTTQSHSLDAKSPDTVSSHAVGKPTNSSSNVKNYEVFSTLNKNIEYRY